MNLVKLKPLAIGVAAALVVLAIPQVTRMLYRRAAEERDPPALRLDALIEQVRKELLSAQVGWNEEGSEALFQVESLDLEVSFTIRESTSTNAEAGFELIALGSTSNVEASRVHHIKLHLSAIADEQVLNQPSESIESLHSDDDINELGEIRPRGEP